MTMWTTRANALSRYRVVCVARNKKKNMKHVRECLYCGENFEANRHQKYCTPDHKMADFYRRRGFEKAHYEEIIGERDMSINVMTDIINKLDARVTELVARNEELEAKLAAKKPRAKVATS
jgi:hypothetical protein